MSPIFIKTGEYEKKMEILFVSPWCFMIISEKKTTEESFFSYNQNFRSQHLKSLLFSYIYVHVF